MNVDLRKLGRGLAWDVRWHWGYLLLCTRWDMGVSAARAAENCQKGSSMPFALEIFDPRLSFHLVETPGGGNYWSFTADFFSCSMLNICISNISKHISAICKYFIKFRSSSRCSSIINIFKIPQPLPITFKIRWTLHSWLNSTIFLVKLSVLLQFSVHGYTCDGFLCVNTIKLSMTLKILSTITYNTRIQSILHYDFQ